jgi:hypothetical protein
VCLDFDPKCFGSLPPGSAVAGASHRLKAAQAVPALTFLETARKASRYKRGVSFPKDRKMAEKLELNNFIACSETYKQRKHIITEIPVRLVKNNGKINIFLAFIFFPLG